MEQEPNTFSVRLTKRPPHGLGFLVRKRKNNPPVVISDLIPGGVAEQSGLVQIGDILVAVNGVQLRDVPYNTALEVLRSVPMDSACVIVLRGPDGYRTRLESVLGPDGSVRVVRITDADPENEKTGTEKRRVGKAGGMSPTAAQGWGRNVQNDHGVRYASPVRRARSATRSPSRGSHTGSPIRTYPTPQFRDQSPCCCNRNIPEYQSVMAWNGSFPREVYQYRLAAEDFYYEGSPRPSVDYDYDNDRMRNGMSLIDEKQEPQFTTTGTQWPERVFLVRSRSGLSGVSTPGTENGFEVIPKLCPYDSEAATPTNEQTLSGLNIPTEMKLQEVTSDDFKEITQKIEGLVNGEVSEDKSSMADGIPSKEASTSPIPPTNKEIVKKVEMVDSKMQTDKDKEQTTSVCPVSGIESAQTNGSAGHSALVVSAKRENKQKFVRLKNLIDGNQFTDTLHQKTFLVSMMLYQMCRQNKTRINMNRLVVGIYQSETFLVVLIGMWRKFARSLSTDCNKKPIQSENRIFENFFRINPILFLHIS